VDLTNFLSPLNPVTKDLISYIPVLQLQGGYWLAVRQADIALNDAVSVYLIVLPYSAASEVPNAP
jgi:hypothetical protein